MLALRRVSAPKRPAFVLGTLLVVLALPASALGQATRTWVSGVGDDVNPCSRTAPCKTFAGAISKTAAGGEIDALDPGGFGGFTITKAITIQGAPFDAGVLVSGTNGIAINAAATDNVTLRNLNIDGVGTGTSGVAVLQARNVRVENSEIYGFHYGVNFEPSNTNATLTVDNTNIENNGDGVIGAPSSTGSGKVLLSNDQIDGNTCGAAAGSFSELGTPGPDDCGFTGPGTGAPVMVATLNSSVTNNTGAGIYTNGGVAASVIGKDTIYGNGLGLASASGGGIFSFGDNDIFGNTVDGTSTSALVPHATSRGSALNTIWTRVTTAARKSAKTGYNKRQRDTSKKHWHASK